MSHRPQTSPAYTYQQGTPFRSTSRKCYSKTLKLCTLDTITDLDTHIQFNTPRSIECCRRLGIDPNTELLYHKQTYFMDQYIDNTTELIHTHIPNYAVVRYEHYNKKRQEKLALLRKLRADMVTTTDKSGTVTVLSNTVNNKHNNNDIFSKTTTHVLNKPVDTVTVLDNERKQVHRMHQREMSKLKNKLLYELRCATLQQQQQSEIQAEQQRQEHERLQAEQRYKQKCELELQQRLQHQKQLERENEQKRIQAHHDWLQQQQQINERMEQQKQAHKQHRSDQVQSAARAAMKKQQLDDILEQQKQRIAAKAHQLEQREQQRLEALSETRKLQQIQQNHADKRKQQRYATQQANNQRIEQDKRDLYEQRDLLAEQRRILLEKQRLAETKEAQHHAMLREQHAQKCRDEAEAVLQAKRNAVLDKHSAVRKRMDAEEEQRKQNAKQENDRLTAAEKHRQDIYNANQLLMQQRIHQLNERIAAAEQRHHNLVQKQQKELAERKLHEELINQDRQDKIQHTERIHQYKRDKLLERVEHDTQRVALIKHTREQLQQQKQRIRDTAYKKTTELVEQLERITHRGDWGKLQSTDEQENIFLKTGVITQNELIDVVSPKTKRGSRPSTAYKERPGSALTVLN